MSNKIIIHCLNDDSRKEFEQNDSLIDILEGLNLKSKMPYISARVNNKVESLTYRAYGSKTVEFLDYTDPSARRTYVRSLNFLLIKAIKEIVPEATVNIEHPVSRGYYCRITNDTKIGEKEVEKIKAKIQEYIDADMPFVGTDEETTKVVELFRERGFEDKALLLETSGQLYSRYYKLGNSIDYFYGNLVPSTGYISTFGLEVYNGGLLLRVPKQDNMKELEPVTKQEKMFEVYHASLELLDILNLSNVGDLNKANIEGRTSEIIQISEAIQERMISDIATDIANKKKDGLKAVLISGPSSSGKTSLRLRLETQLKTHLIRPVGVSLDDYFVDRDDTPLDEHGEFDFESLYALDIPKFNEDLKDLMAGKEVKLPSFNFETGKREYKGKKLQLEDNSVIIIEGIHGLNPELTPDIPKKQKYQIYISALTTISLDNHNRIPTTDNRLLRRMIRDYKYRGYSPMDTISRFPSVHRGEQKWIFPYQENADAMFNSAMIYEFASLRSYAEPILAQVPKSAPEYAEAHRLLKFLSYFNYIDDKELPPTSLLREFVGGSSFNY